MPRSRVINSYTASFVCLLLSNGFSCCTKTDIFCLESIKKSLEDPYDYLTSWDFTDLTGGNLCKFSGITCWHPDENRVLSITLSDMGLKGRFPVGIVNCSSLTGLDLSKNKLSGEIPSNISQILGYLTTLDLSWNGFTGEIPKSLANCTYLNVLKLDHNQLSGEIPSEIGLLGRLSTFSVANNLLRGRVPQFINLTNTAAMYANNGGLCGDPSMRACAGPSSKPHCGAFQIARTAVGGVVLAAMTMGICVLLFFCRRL